MIYAYCRVSTQHQKIARQITNITAIYPNAIIIKEFLFRGSPTEKGATVPRKARSLCLPRGTRGIGGR